MKKTFKRLHLWLSVPFGIIISLICFTGALLVFEREVTELIRYDRYHVQEVRAQKLPIHTLVDKVVPELKEGVTITGVTVSNDPARPYKINLSEPRRAGMMVDQYSGKVLGMDERMPFFVSVFKLHRWLLCERPDNDGDIWWGKLVVGISTLMFVFVLISGIIAWWPKTTRGLRKQMRINTRRGLKRFFLELHTIGGVYACVVLLAMALTGLTWSFDWYRTGFNAVFGVMPEKKDEGGAHGNGNHGHGKPGEARQKAGDAHGKPEMHHGKPEMAHGQQSSAQAQVSHSQQAAEEESEEVPTVPSNYGVWQRVYEQVRQKEPQASSITVDEEEADASLGNLGNARAANTYSYDAENGDLTDVERYADAKRKQKIRGWIYAVHTDSWGGYLTRILQCLAALFGASLPLTGYYLWIKRSVKKKRK